MSGSYVEYLRDQYQAHPSWLEEHRRWVKRYEISGRVLDAGSGFGHLALACEEAGCKVLGVERDGAIAVEAAATTGFKNTVWGDVSALPFKEASFDWVLSNQVIEHLRDPSSFLRECTRVLASDGRLFLTTPNRRSHFATRRPKRLLEALMGRAKSDPTHVHEFVPRELARLIEANRLRVLCQEAVGRLSSSWTTRAFAGGTLIVARKQALE